MDLPAYADLQLRNSLRPASYTLDQRKSAYMAEFMRVWQPDSERALLADAKHAAEVQYFLTYRIADSAVVELAQKHAELLLSDQLKFASPAATVGNVMTRADNLAVYASMVPGVALFQLILLCAFDAHSRKFPNIRMTLR